MNKDTKNDDEAIEQFTCVQCGTDLETEHQECGCVDWYCNAPECPNYKLVQIA